MINHKLYIHNSLTRQKELFTPIEPGRIGMYVCGPTVYNDVHLGNCRTFTNFDIIYRLLVYLGYKVRYVRNITDVGHLLDDGEDRLAKGARLNQIEPMEVAQKYTVGFHEMMRILNNLPPNIEPRATGHIIEQIELTEKILENGYAYVQDGSVYFSTLDFIKENPNIYGQLSGRVVEELLAESRENLKNQDTKKHPSDFALWIKADDTHIMQWNSPWSLGFPGWHLECSAMSTKYLGEKFDIHGGGLDLKFPHHENEIAQNYGGCNSQPANYWIHANMLQLNGKKMSKSDGNYIMPYELFAGESPLISKGYSPMTLRFLTLQSHYRSTLDLNDEALAAAEKGYLRLMDAAKLVQTISSPIVSGGTLDTEIYQLLTEILEDLCDDFNVPKSLSKFFELATKINGYANGQIEPNAISQDAIERIKTAFNEIVFGVFGLLDESGTNGSSASLDLIMDLIIDIRAKSRENKDWGTSDKIRDTLANAKIQIMDGKEGTSWKKL